VYYISEVLSETKARYPQIQKLLYAVVLARRELRHYFEAHRVTVVSSFLLGEIIRNPDAAGRIAKWSVELMGETLTYTPPKAIKSQILADFVVEWMDTQLPACPHYRYKLNVGPSTSMVGDENQGRRGSALRLAPQGAHEIRCALAFPRVQQHGGVRGPPLWSLNRHRNRHQVPRCQGRLAARD
jgi:hypothetical protein